MTVELFPVGLRHRGLSKDPSASSAESFVQCTASHVLPGSPTQTVQAVAGTKSHEPVAKAINYGGAQIEDISELRAETAYVVDVKERTSRFIGQDIGRDYGKLEPYEMGVTLDAEGRLTGDTLWCRDWKFGTYAQEMQLYVQAMALLWRPEEKAILVNAGFVFLREKGRPEPDPDDPNGEVVLPLMGRMEIEEKADELVAAFDRVGRIHDVIRSGGQPALNQGSWCRYCPALDRCPAKNSLIRSALGQLGEVEEKFASLTAVQCGQAWEKLKEIKRLAEKVENTLKTRLETDGVFPLSGGKEVYLLPMKGRASYDMEKVNELFDELDVSPGRRSLLMKRGAEFTKVQERKAKR